MSKHISKYWLPVVVVLVIVGAILVFIQRGSYFELPKGETVPLRSIGDDSITSGDNSSDIPVLSDDKISKTIPKPHVSVREMFVTDGVKHSIAIDEILSGGPQKDGIPSIDNPKFVSVKEIKNVDDFLNDDSIGLGVIRNGDIRFYPYQILVWHEIVNDIVGGEPLLVTYCPLCATGIVFDRIVNEKIIEFGVSGKLWRSNLLMYNRAIGESNESLWSQVLGEAVLGMLTGTRLTIIPSDTVRFGDWRREYPDTKVLSSDTGINRSYGLDPYGSYYTDEGVAFGATFDDTRLHPKAFVLGVEIDGMFKAYHMSALEVGITNDSFSEKEVTIEKSDIGEVKMFVGEDKIPLSYIGGFWFSWLAVHPQTSLYK